MMKRSIIMLFTLLFVTIIPMNAYAVGMVGNSYNVNGITVEFAVDSSFTAEEQAAIAEFVANEKENSSATTYNLLCTLFGHKTTIESFTVIEHCVSDTAPRCVESIQDVTACTRCETVIDIQLITSNYIFCCD